MNHTTRVITNDITVTTIKSLIKTEDHQETETEGVAVQRVIILTGRRLPQIHSAIFCYDINAQL